MVDYKKISALLEKNLAGSAFRRGTSAHRLGLMQEGISDHLPIQIRLNEHKTSTTIVSWNLLADAHLYNNFMNISGTQELLAALSEDNIYGGKRNNKLYHYFSELGQFIYDKRKTDHHVILDSTLLAQFNSVQNAGSLLTRSRDPRTSEQNIRRVQESRQAIAALLLNKDHDDAHEFQLAIQHSVDLIYHIKHEQGILKWSNRLKKLHENKELVGMLSNSDFLCLQECTNPADIHALMPQKHALVHRVNQHTTDHCALFYNPSQYKLVGEPLYFALDDGKKPCIMARFEHLTSGKQLIVGSIHHPGGTENHLDEIVDKINQLKHSANEAIEFYLPGDYNHSQEFFKKNPSFQHPLLYPSLGTMAGADYGNINQSIDAILTNKSANQIDIERIPCLSISKPAEMPLKVHFKDEQVYRPKTSPSFERPVQREVVRDELHDALDILGQNNATYAPIMAF